MKKQLVAKSNEVTELKSFVVAAVPSSSFLSVLSSARSSQVTSFCKCETHTPTTASGSRPKIFYAIEALASIFNTSEA